MEESVWDQIDDYPYTGADAMNYFSVIFQNSGFLVFGSNSSNSKNKIIGRLDADTRVWSNVGSLVTPRYGHRVIFTGLEFMVVGGYGPLKTEKCIQRNGMIVCEQQEPELNSYDRYPELMMVSKNYCITKN